MCVYVCVCVIVCVYACGCVCTRRCMYMGSVVDTLRRKCSVGI